ncbi:Imm51 family immunity protein [Streptomyces incanus]|uniref:Imm51 family immunity protein n=1 Tax=Streptomyces incanus TaxID=887453 RepID=A0ABW0XP35_9ACTN
MEHVGNVFEEHDAEANGHGREDLAQSPALSLMSELADEMDFGPESGTFVVTSTGITALKRPGDVLRGASQDRDLLARHIQGAAPFFLPRRRTANRPQPAPHWGCSTDVAGGVDHCSAHEEFLTCRGVRYWGCTGRLRVQSQAGPGGEPPPASRLLHVPGSRLTTHTNVRELRAAWYGRIQRLSGTALSLVAWSP